jgi:hypothetical protein
MTQEQLYFAEGFIKRAQEYGFSQDEAIGLLELSINKQANLPPPDPKDEKWTDGFMNLVGKLTGAKKNVIDPLEGVNKKIRPAPNSSTNTVVPVKPIKPAAK